MSQEKIAPIEDQFLIATEVIDAMNQEIEARERRGVAVRKYFDNQGVYDPEFHSAEEIAVIDHVRDVLLGRAPLIRE